MDFVNYRVSSNEYIRKLQKRLESARVRKNSRNRTCELAARSFNGGRNWNDNAGKLRYDGHRVTGAALHRVAIKGSRVVSS